MSLVLEDKIAATIYRNDSGEMVLRTVPAVSLPSKWDDIVISNNVSGNPTEVKYYLDSTFLLKVTISYDVDNETITRVQTSTTE